MTEHNTLTKQSGAKTRAVQALAYQSGFGNEFATEARPGALPVGRNSPQKPAYGLYTELISGTAFTAPRAENRRTWTYRTRPSVVHNPYKRIDNKMIRSAPFNEMEATPSQLRWSPFPLPNTLTDFVDGIHTIGGSGDVAHGDRAAPFSHGRLSAKRARVRGNRAASSSCSAAAYCRISHCAAGWLRSVRNASQLRRLAEARIRL